MDTLTFWRTSTVILVILLSGSLLWPNSSQEGKLLKATGARNVVAWPASDDSQLSGPTYKDSITTSRRRPPPAAAVAFQDLGLGAPDGGDAVSYTTTQVDVMKVRPPADLEDDRLTTASSRHVDDTTSASNGAAAAAAAAGGGGGGALPSTQPAEAVAPFCSAELHTGDIRCEKGVCGPYRTQGTKGAALMVPDTAACCKACLEDDECMT